jgi:hypothetical protein
VTPSDVTKLRARLNVIREIVNAQAEDDGLWFVAETAPEAYLQQELRRLGRGRSWLLSPEPRRSAAKAEAGIPVILRRWFWAALMLTLLYLPVALAAALERTWLIR